MKITIKVIYDWGAFEQEYEKMDTFCPNCGSSPVWEETGVGDYHTGSEIICLKCGSIFSVQFWNSDDDIGRQRIELLRRKAQ